MLKLRNATQAFTVSLTSYILCAVLAVVAVFIAVKPLLAKSRAIEACISGDTSVCSPNVSASAAAPVPFYLDATFWIFIAILAVSLAFALIGRVIELRLTRGVYGSTEQPKAA